MIDGYDTTTLVVGTVLFLGSATLIVGWGWLGPLHGRADRWATSRSVVLTDESRPYVMRRLRSARRWRTTAVAIAWVSPWAYQIARRSAYDSLDHAWAVLLGGYLLGVIGAELWAARRTPRGRGALLEPRDVNQYVTPSLFTWCRRSVIASAAVTSFASFAPVQDDPTTGWVWSTRTHAAWSVVAVGLLGAAHLLARLIVSRRQPYRGEGLTRADDALRSWSAHACVGACLGALLLIVSNQLWNIAAWSDWTLLRWSGAVTSFAIACTAIGTIQVTTGPDWRWTVRRDGLAGEGTSA